MSAECALYAVSGIVAFYAGWTLTAAWRIRRKLK